MTEGEEAAALPPLREVAAVITVVKGEAEVGVEPQLPLAAATVVAVKEAAVREAAAVALLPLPLEAEVGVVLLLLHPLLRPPAVEVAAEVEAEASVAMVAVHLPRHLLAVAVIKEEGVSSVVAVKEAAPQLLRLRADPAAAVITVVKGEAASGALGALLRLLQHPLRVAAVKEAAVKEAAVAL